jgi:hypothetical protein
MIHRFRSLKYAAPLVPALFLLLYGCADPNNGDSGPQNNIELPPGKWTELTPAPSPSARILHAAVYDSNRKQVILFGGKDESGFLNDTWCYDPVENVWEQHNTVGSPPPRLGHVMVYDPVQDRVVLFGGEGELGEILNDMWAYDVLSKTWSLLQPVGVVPSARQEAAVAYDPDNQQMILFGGKTDAGLDDETWAFDLVTNLWEKKAPPASPSARSGHTLAYDSFNHQAILFGGDTSAGRSDETWAYAVFNDTWSPLFPPNKPAPRSLHGMVYETEKRRVLMYGGFVSGSPIPNGETWVFDYSTGQWTQLFPPAPVPKARFLHAMTYDPSTLQTILFGGAVQGCGSPGCSVDSEFFAADTWMYQSDVQ